MRLGEQSITTYNRHQPSFKTPHALRLSAAAPHTLGLRAVQHNTGTTPARNIFSVSVRSERNMPALLGLLLSISLEEAQRSNQKKTQHNKLTN